MGQCCSRQYVPRKQNKDIDDRKMFKASIELMNKEFSVGIGYNRKARKNYSDVVHVDNTVHQVIQGDEGSGSQANEVETQSKARRRQAQET